MADCENYLCCDPPLVSQQKKPKDVCYWLKNKGKHFLLYIASFDGLKWQYYESAIWHLGNCDSHPRVMALLGVKGLKSTAHAFIVDVCLWVTGEIYLQLLFV